MPEVISPIEKGYVGTESIVAPGDIIIEGETLVASGRKNRKRRGRVWRGERKRTPSFVLEADAERVVARIVSWSAGSGSDSANRLLVGNRDYTRYITGSKYKRSAGSRWRHQASAWRQPGADGNSTAN